MLKIAITGNIASGKSEAEKILKNMGYPVYDADVLAHEVLDGMTDFYGYDVFTDGKIDRKKLGNLVFKNYDIKTKLEEVTHPRIRERIINIFDYHKNDKYVFVSVPLLYEAGFEDIFDKVIFIFVKPDLQLKRLMKRNNFSEEEAKLRINSQINQEEKINKADFVLVNNTTIEDLNEQLQNIIKIFD